VAAGILLGGYSIYFLIIALWGLRSAQKAPVAVPKTRFALVVAARNEAAVIGHLVDSMLALDYPRELFDVIVAPNNCTDDTAAVAQAHGAQLFIPQGPVHSKGDALSQMVDSVVLPGGYDAMCVFDADNLVDGAFLQHMNAQLLCGAQIVQGFRDSKNPRQSAMSGCYSICYWMVNRFYNRGRAALGLSALVNGSGFAVSRDMLLTLGGWHTKTMTEDYEISAQCALAGGRVTFCEDARVYDEQPITFGESWKQRRRWTTGSLQGMRLYGGELFKNVVLRRSAVCLDLYLTFLMPLVQVISLVCGIGSVAIIVLRGTLLLHGVLVHGATIAMLFVCVSLLLAIGGSMLLAAFVVVLQRMPLRDMAKGIVTYWVFLLSHMALTLLSFVHQQTAWEPVAHTAAVSLSQIQKK
ncbi:MAG: glycosyltransferase family 2 protein, partial [Ruthenibacterium sp.]